MQLSHAYPVRLLFKMYQLTPLNIYLILCFDFFALVSRQSVTLSSTTQRALPPEFG